MDDRQLPAGILIRPARASDVDSFLEFWRGIVGEGRLVRSETVRHPRRHYRRWLRDSWSPDAAQLLALDGDRVAGHVSLTREAHPATRHVATLDIAVAAPYRRRGIGAALLRAGIRWARSQGVQKLMLSVYPHNDAAIELYRRFGFVQEGRLARHSRKSYGYEDEILMAAWIDDEGSMG
jgi:ribosomal protein S18 acetylase RimI-like enzyme